MQSNAMRRLSLRVDERDAPTHALYQTPHHRQSQAGAWLAAALVAPGESLERRRAERGCNALAVIAHLHDRAAAIVEQPHVDRGAAMLECVVDEIAHRALEELGVAWR